MYPLAKVDDVLATLDNALFAKLNAIAGDNWISRDDESKTKNPWILQSVSQQRAASNGRAWRNNVYERQQSYAQDLIEKTNQSDGWGAQVLSQKEIRNIKKINAHVGDALLRCYEIVTGRKELPSISPGAAFQLGKAFKSLQWQNSDHYQGTATLSKALAKRLEQMNQSGDGPENNIASASTFRLFNRDFTALHVAYNDGMDVEIYNADGHRVGSGSMDGGSWTWDWVWKEDALSKHVFPEPS